MSVASYLVALAAAAPRQQLAAPNANMVPPREITSLEDATTAAREQALLPRWDTESSGCSELTACQLPGIHSMVCTLFANSAPSTLVLALPHKGKARTNAEHTELPEFAALRFCGLNSKGDNGCALLVSDAPTMAIYARANGGTGAAGFTRRSPTASLPTAAIAR